MLVCSCFSIFLIIEGFVFRAVPDNTFCCLNDVVAQISIAGFAHVFVLGYEIARVIIVPNDAAVFCENIGVLENLDRTHFS